ncbi:ABC transporter substrate-binding protein [Conexibacter arvalis]|uniref:Peptide/nickel transport system substrate-binding protein n=1 Tax=Conexibacter arvalis TaxID=912552 RepID=A0A840I7Y8_9ACTN|nr:peptide/nickel transport system substrate-binding protein [Conexibacter arvalis]
MTIFNEPRVNRRQALAVGGAFTLSGLLAACGGGSSGQASDAGPATAVAGGSGKQIDALSISVPQLGDLLHTTRAVGPILGITLLGMEPLVLYQPDGSLAPNLAESWEQPSLTRYVFKLRRGVRFWDGSPLTPADVVASFDVHVGRSTESASASYWTSVERVSARGDEIVVELAAPDPAFIYTVARTGIFSAAFARRRGDKLGSPSVLNLGTGPYRFTAFTPLSRVRLERNDGYWGRAPPIGRIDAQVLNQDTLLLGVQSGEVDAAFALPVSQLKSFTSLPDFALQNVPDAAVYKFNMVVDRAPWDDVHLRRAFAHAVDREAIARGVLNGADPATTLEPPTTFDGALPRSEVDEAYAELAQLMPAYDLDKARQELAQSRYPDGIKTEVLVMASDPNLSAITQTAAQGAAEIGIKIDVREVDENTYINAVYLRHTTDGLSIDNFGAGGPDLLNIPDLTLNSRNIPPTGFTNVANYESAAVDELLARASRLRVDDARRAQLALDVLRRAGEDLPYVPVAFPKVYLGVKREYAYAGFNAFWWLNRWPDQIVAQD